MKMTKMKGLDGWLSKKASDARRGIPVRTDGNLQFVKGLAVSIHGVMMSDQTFYSMYVFAPCQLSDEDYYLAYPAMGRSNI